MASEEERISIEDDLATQQSQGDDSVFVDMTPEASAPGNDDAPAPDNTDQLQNNMGEADGETDTSATPQPPPPQQFDTPQNVEGDTPQDQFQSSGEEQEAADVVGGEEEGTTGGVEDGQAEEGQLLGAEGGEEEEEEEPGELPVTSTPKPKSDSKSPGKSLKQRLGQIPARLSKLSIFNAIRSGTYVVSEPPPPPPSSDNVNTNTNTTAENTENTGQAKPSGKQVKTMTDNGVVAGDDTSQVEMTKMPEEGLAEPEGEEGLPGLQAPSHGASRKPHSVHRSALTKLLCGLYALMLVVFGVVFAVANSLTVKERQHLYYLEVFLLYLYVGSLATLLYFQICILRGKQVRNAYLDNSIRVIIRRSQDNIQLSPCPSRKDNMPTTPECEEREIGLEPRKEPLDQMSTLSNASDFRSHLVLPPPGQVAHVGEGINFYLRLGCLAFSIGSVTLDGFHIASYFETENTTTCESHLFILVYICHLIFTFIQTFFLFKNHKLVIDKNKASVRFGLMHLLATNLCVWFVMAVTETSEDFRQQDYLDNRNESIPMVPKSCYEDVTLARTASPYLFPCTIIYSIIAGGIVYRMYTYVGIKVKQRWPSHTSLTSSAAPQGVVSMDCEKANKGLFSGLLIAVVTLIAIATFFVFDSRLNNPMTAIKVFFVTEISLLILTGGCIVVGKIRFQKLRFLENYLSLDSVLLLVSLAGAYIYLCFMLISSASTLDTFGVVSVLSLVTIAVGLVQSTLQAIFILDGLCRRADSDAQVESKPGRAVVTFVLVCNLALWVVTLFEIRKTIVVPFHRSFYGILPWNIILHLCVPLYIYFRFHSAICLSKIWFNAYQKGDKMA